jgi:hypothetical protein
MRKLPYLLVLLFLSLMLLAAAASAHASTLPPAASVAALSGHADDVEADDSSEAADESEASEDEAEENEGGDEGKDCSAEDEAEEELCEEEAEEEAEECLLEDADASVVVSPSTGAARLTIRYDTFEPTTVAIDTSLHGGKGGLHLGSERTRFRRSGTFHDSFSLGGKQLTKALAARGFEVDLRAAGTPANCTLHLANRVPHRAK